MTEDRNRDWHATKCPIWGSPAKQNPDTSGDYTEFYSARAGGYFMLTGSAVAINKDQAKTGLSKYIAQQNMAGATPKLTSNDIAGYENPSSDTISEQYNAFLGSVAFQYPRLGDSFTAQDLWAGQKSWFIEAVLGSPDSMDAHYRQEIEILIEAAIDRGHLEQNDQPARLLHISVNGRQYVEELGVSLSESEQIFVAMWFGSDAVKRFYNQAVKPAIEAAGYTAMRIDDHEHNEKIDDQIISEIRKSKALVCDITCGLAKPIGNWSTSTQIGAPRGGVFYEAGFAHGFGLPVIWTVKKDVAEIENVSHFDVRQFNQIRWSGDLEEAKQRLQNRIEATLGKPTS